MISVKKRRGEREKEKERVERTNNGNLNKRELQELRESAKSGVGFIPQKLPYRRP